jgi:alpha-ketoglutarate-dependent 2,4-dichlorophenoxyacetate dioxygenase
LSPFGLELDGVDLRSIDVDELRNLLDEHALLVLRGQHLARDEHVALAERFGRVDEFDTRTPNATTTPYVAREPGQKVVVELGGSATPGVWEAWRSDASFKERPATVSIRCAVESGGETEVADMRAAHEALPDRERERLQPLTAWHSAIYARAAAGEIAVEPTDDPTALPGAAHPVVRPHPSTGRPALFVGENACCVLGMDVAESQQLLGRLTEDACRPPRVHAHAWHAGDVLIWDNRAVLHRSVSARERLLRHVTVVEP